MQGFLKVADQTDIEDAGELVQHGWRCIPQSSQRDFEFFLRKVDAKISTGGENCNLGVVLLTHRFINFQHHPISFFNSYFP